MDDSFSDPPTRERTAGAEADAESRAAFGRSRLAPLARDEREAVIAHLRYYAAQHESKAPGYLQAIERYWLPSLDD